MAPISKPKVQVAPERLGLKKVWNLSDWPDLPMPAHTIVALGAALPPGGVLSVPPERLKNAHKLLKMQETGHVHIGDAPPKAYLDWKASSRVRLARDVNRAHHVTPEESQLAAEDNEQRAKTAQEGREAPKAEPPKAEVPAPAPEEVRVRLGRRRTDKGTP